MRMFFLAVGGSATIAEDKDQVRAKMAEVSQVQTPLWRGQICIGLPPCFCLVGPLPAASTFLFSSPRWESRSNASAGSVMLCCTIKQKLTPLNFNVWCRNLWPVQPAVLCSFKPPDQGSSGAGCYAVGPAVGQLKQAYHRTWFILFHIVGFNKALRWKMHHAF